MKSVSFNLSRCLISDLFALFPSLILTHKQKAIGEICRKHKVFFHTDAAQAVGKIPINVDDMNIDLLSISGHKVYGPKGIGALFVRRTPRVRLDPIISGGGQERGFRSGTLPVPLVVGLGKACEIARNEMEFDSRHVKTLFDRLKNGIESVCFFSFLSFSFRSFLFDPHTTTHKQRIPHSQLNGDATQRYLGNCNFSFAYVEGESLLMSLRDVALSSGSACTSASLEPSYVLRALGVEDEMAHTSIRFGMGRFTTVEEIDFVVDLCERHVKRLRDMSPLWELVQEGVDLKTIEWVQDH